MEELLNAIKSISQTNDADVYLFSATISDETGDKFIDLIRKKSPPKSTCYLILTTNGGDPDAGYRIVRAIKRVYKNFILCVMGSCKSTGTLIALGADKILMGNFGEFGPLDIQLTKDDEMLNTSGLSYLQSLLSLNDNAFRSFEDSFMKLKRNSGGTITTKTAAEIASKLAVGLISPISAQIDPIKLGEVQRAIKIADAYGRRICDDQNLVSTLILAYPSHSFVIDFEESKKLFKNVEWLGVEEKILEEHLFQLVRSEGSEDIVGDLLSESEDINEGKEEADLTHQSETPQQNEPIQSSTFAKPPIIVEEPIVVETPIAPIPPIHNT